MVAEKKKCPYCERVIGRAGWAMHYSTKHVEREFKAFDKVDALAAVESGDKSFRGSGGGKMERKPRPKKREERREEPDEPEEDDDDWGTLLDD